MLRQIKDLLGRWRDSSEFGERSFNSIRSAVLFFAGHIPDEPYAKLFYKIYTGKTLDLEHPRYFNEKMWWLKLHNRDPLLTKCSDKHRAREYVAECGFPEILIPQVGVFKNAAEIDFSKYAFPVMFKCNKGSGFNVLYDPADRGHFNEKAARKKLNRALTEKYHLISREWNYKNIPPCIVAEKVIRDKKGNFPVDYRFFCFDGIPRVMLMDIGLLTDQGRHRFEYPRNAYDMDFNLLPIRFGRDRYDGVVDRPENFERMIEIAKKLSQPFPMCRVDLYNVDGVIYFGEITFYHGGCCQEITPEEWDLKLGTWIDLDNKKIVLDDRKKGVSVKKKSRILKSRSGKSDRFGNRQVR